MNTQGNSIYAAVDESLRDWECQRASGLSFVEPEKIREWVEYFKRVPVEKIMRTADKCLIYSFKASSSSV